MSNQTLIKHTTITGRTLKAISSINETRHTELKLCKSQRQNIKINRTANKAVSAITGAYFKAPIDAIVERPDNQGPDSQAIYQTGQKLSIALPKCGKAVTGGVLGFLGLDNEAQGLVIRLTPLDAYRLINHPDLCNLAPSFVYALHKEQDMTDCFDKPKTSNYSYLQLRGLFEEYLDPQELVFMCAIVEYFDGYVTISF